MDIRPEPLQGTGTDQNVFFCGQADPCCPECGCLICACGSN